MLEFPILFKKSFNIPKTNWNITGKLGYGISYAISAIQTLTPLDTNFKPTTEELNLNDPSIAIHRWDHGAYTGLEFGYQIRPHHYLTAETNYYLGKSNIDKLNYTKNRSLSFGLYVFIVVLTPKSHYKIYYYLQFLVINSSFGDNFISYFHFNLTFISKFNLFYICLAYFSFVLIYD